MDSIERRILTTTWWQALVAGGDAPAASEQARRLLSELVDDLAVHLVAEDFDASPGARIGAALAAAGWTDPAVPTISAQALQYLADHCSRYDAAGRFAALCTALGLGHQAQLQRVRNLELDQEELRHDANAKFHIVFDNAAIAIAIGDTDGTLVEANRGLAEMIGVPVEQLREISVYDFAHPDDQDEIRNLVYDKLVPAGDGSVKLERRLLRADGSVGWVAFSITYVKGGGGQDDYLLAVGEDVTEQHRLQQELYWQAQHDPLTGLPNRRHLIERIEDVAAASGADDQVGLCFIDLDRFKPINDKYGHGTGDQVLREVASRFQDGVREQDCLIARIGGDEFVALIPPPAESQLVTAVADQLLAALADPISVNDHQLQISASIGAIVTPIAGSDAESLLDSADTVLYFAKTNRKGNSVVCRSRSVTEVNRLRPR